jgi:hypothetical protein
MTSIARVTLHRLSNQELLTQIQHAAHGERRATARLIALLAELDTRRLYLAEGFSSLFTYCTQALHLSEHAAYNRIEAARAATRCPVLLDLLEAGSVTLTTIRLLAPHLTEENHEEVLRRACDRSKREIEEQVATLAPAVDTASAPRSLLLPLTPESYQLQFTVNRETYDRLQRVQDLLRHSVPDGNVGLIFERAIALLLRTVERLPRIARGRRVTEPLNHGTSRRQSAGQCGDATAGGARSRARRDAALRQGFSSTTMSSRLPRVAKLRSRISS